MKTMILRQFIGSLASKKSRMVNLVIRKWMARCNGIYLASVMMMMISLRNMSARLYVRLCLRPSVRMEQFDSHWTDFF
jgi:hypothetical protein